MGNSAKKPDDYEIVSSYNHRQWVVKDQLLHCQIWKNTVLNYDVEAYEVETNTKPEELDKYTFRNQNNKDIVGVYHVIPQQNQFLCSKGDKMHILTERIPVTLDKVNNLSQSQALCVLTSAYSGYNTIGSHYGPVMPYQNCIGFNQSGKPKVWVNSNFALNKPFKNQLINDSEQLQKRNRSYVREIFNMVEKRTIDGLPRLRQIFTKKEPTYFEALNILEHYNQTTGIRVPSSIDLRHLNINNIQQEQKAFSPIADSIQGYRELGPKLNNQAASASNLINSNQINQSVNANQRFQSVRTNTIMNGNQSNYNKLPIYQYTQNVQTLSYPTHNQVYYSPNHQQQFQQRKVFASPPPQTIVQNQNTRIINQNYPQGAIIQQFQNSANNPQVDKINVKKSQRIVNNSENAPSSNKQLNDLLEQSQKQPQSQNLIQDNMESNEQQNINSYNQVRPAIVQSRQQIQYSQNQIDKQQRQSKQQIKVLQSSRVEKVNNNEILEKHIQQHKSQQNIPNPSQNQLPQLMLINQNLTNPYSPQMPNQNQFKQQRVYVNQQNPQIQQQPAYYQNSHAGASIQYRQPQYIPQQQILVRDQFGRLFYVNQSNQPPQISYGNHPVMRTQILPSPQTIYKTQNIQQARRSGRQSPNNIKSEEQIQQKNQQVNDLPKNSEIKQLTEIKTDSVVVQNKNTLQRFKQKYQQGEPEVQNEDQIDYRYADLKPRKKSSGSNLLRNANEPHVLNDQQNDDQYQQYIQLQKQRQQRKLRQAQRQKQRKTRQKQPVYQNRYEDNTSLQKRNNYDEYYTNQSKVSETNQSSNKVIRAYSNNQRRNIESQAQRQPLSKQVNQLARRSNKQISYIKERDLNDQYSKQIQQSLIQQYKKVQNNTPSYQQRQPRFGRKDKQESLHYQQSEKDYKSIDENRYINRGYDLNQNLNRSTKSPTGSPSRRNRNQKQNKRSQRQQSPKSHTSGRSRSSQLQMARLDRQREKLQRQRKQIEGRQKQRDQYWNQQKRATEGSQNYRRQNRVRFNQQVTKKQQPQQFDWNKYKQQRQERRKNEKQQRNKIVQHECNQHDLRTSQKESKQNSRKVNDQLDIPAHQPALQNIISVTTAYQVVNASNADQRPPNQYSHINNQDSYSNRYQRRRNTKDPQPVIPQNYQIDDIQAYIRKKYNIQSQPQNTTQYQPPTRYQRGAYEYKNTTSKYDNYQSKYDKYDTSKYNTSKYQSTNKHMQQSDRSGKGDQQLGRHNLLTFMPKDKQKNLYIVENQIKKSAEEGQQAFNVADMQKNLIKFEESRHRVNSGNKPVENSSSHYVTKIQTYTEDYGNGQKITRKKYERQYKDQDNPYTKYQSNYQQNIQPSSYQRKKYTRGANEYTKDLDKYKGSSAIDEKYNKYINKRQNLKESYTNYRSENDNSQSYERPTRARTRFEKYTKQSRTFEENAPSQNYDRFDRDKQIYQSNTFVRKQGGIDKLSYNQLKNMLWS